MTNTIENMPLVGFGVYQIAPADCERAVREALEVGYRLIDTAQAYYNEEGVGRGIKASGLDREESFITDKVWISNAGEQVALKSIDGSLKKLQTDYIDLMLIHQTFGDYYGTWRAMERALAAGKVRAIGLSNFHGARLVDMLRHCEIKPAVLQAETHVFYQEEPTCRLMEPYGMRLMAWSPLAQGGQGIFTHPVLSAIAKAHGRSTAQVALRFLTQQGIVVIPKSVHKERMVENLHSTDFELSASEMQTLKGLDTGKGCVDFNSPEFAAFIIDYDVKFNPERQA